MGRSVRTAAICVPLGVAGVLAAHELSYLAVAHGAGHDRAAELARSGHGYLSALPLVAIAAVVVLVVGLIVDARRAGGGRLEPNAWPFAVLAPVTFTVQEHLERFVHDGAFPWDAATQPTFVLGLLMQVPVAFVVWALARVLLRTARRFVVALRSLGDYVRRSSPPRRRIAVPAPPRLPCIALAGAVAGRAPPR